MAFVNRSLLSRLIAAIFTTSLVAAAWAQTPKKEEEEVYPPMPPIQPRSPEETIKATELQPGYSMKLVLAEPHLYEPVIGAFDGDGRLFVAEMRTYMQDADATGESVATSAVMLHWSSKRDGNYDKHSTFIDKLLLPRLMVTLDKGRLLVGETDTNDLYIYSDTNNDGVADKKEIFYEGGSRGGNVEHQPSGPVWGLDNWIYTAGNSYRLRWTSGGIALKEPISGGSGQWGICQDSYGKMWTIGNSSPSVSQTHALYGNQYLQKTTAEGFSDVWPLVGLADVQGGKYNFHPENGRLNRFTGLSGCEIYRGNGFPSDVVNDFFFAEPVGRLIRRAKITETEGFVSLSHPYQAQKTEFIRSNDPMFRPVNLMNGPDGALYIVDMYRGIIQQGAWTRPGSYLRKKIDQYSMGALYGRGRIYKVVHESMKPQPMPSLNSETPAQLVKHLASENSWHRDMAQRLLMIKQDKSVVPALITMAKTHRYSLARVHALWTLESLNALPADVVRAHMKDKDPKVRANALRACETLFKRGDTTFNADIKALAKDPEAEVVLQSLLTANQLQLPGMQMTYAGIVTRSTQRGVKEIGTQIMSPQRRTQYGSTNTTEAERAALKDGASTFQTLCSTCHAVNGRGLPKEGGAPGDMVAPSFADSKTVQAKEQIIRVLLQGLTGDIDGKKYEGPMVSMGTNTNEWIANVLSYVRTTFGNGGMITPQDVAKVREETAGRTQPWTIAELRAVPRMK